MLQFSAVGDIYKNASCACLIIVRDEEKNIAKCLDNVISTGCFQQIIIVVDTRTKDRTPQILREYAARYPEIEVHNYRWKSEDFSAPRNEGLKYAKTDYAFWIDADTIILDVDGLKRLLADPQGKSYHFIQLSPVENGYVFETHQLRLFPLIPGVKWEMPVHEQVAFRLRDLGVQEEVTKYRMLHNGFLDNGVVLDHHKRYYEIMTKFLKNEPEGPRRNYMLKQYENSRTYLSTRGLI